jgi:outer membrane immunogenic protein
MRFLMKKALFLATALATIAGSAFAADLPSRKAPAYMPPPPPPPLWTGFYVGLNAGYTFGDSNSTTIGSFPLVAGFEPAAASAGGIFGGGNRDGFIGGGQIGYNWQFGPQFLAGIEADIQGVASGNGATQFSNGFTAFSITNRLDYLGTVRGRLGWLFTPTLLLYGTGGLAYGGVSSTMALWQPALGGIGGSTFADTRVGWTAGGGVEWMFWPNWSAKVEYLYYDLGSVAATGVSTNAAAVTYMASQTSSRYNGHVVRAGLNYHFNWGAAPVVAKY